MWSLIAFSWIINPWVGDLFGAKKSKKGKKFDWNNILWENCLNNETAKYNYNIFN